MAKLTKFKMDLIRGDTPLVQFPVVSSGLPVDLTGWTAIFTATSNESPSTGYVPDIQVTDTGDTTGVLMFQLLNDQILNATKLLMPDTTYYCDVQLFNNMSGTAKRIFTIFRGSFTVDTDYGLVES